MRIAIAQKESSLGAILLITGCCIGAGMIGLPVVSTFTGFIPSTVALLLCYLFATGTGLLILEATLWFDQRVNLISMADFALGRVGRLLTWTLFLFLFYCLFVAYIDGGGKLFSSMLSAVFHYTIPREIGVICCVSFVGAVVFAGTRAVSLMSRLFLCGLGISYLMMQALGIPHIKGEHLLYTNWKSSLSVIPILLVCFGYQNLIPTLTYYVKRNIHALRSAIFIGNLIPLLIYFLWNFLILGLLPNADSEGSLKSLQNEMVTELLEKASKSSSVLFFASTFSFFAILTPFMANAMTFVDFLKDGLKVKNSNSSFLIYALIFVPPTLCSLLYPHLFLRALGVAGGFADLILFGMLPVSIVWVGRYVKGVKGPYTVAGGKLFLSIIFLLSLAFLVLCRC